MVSTCADGASVEARASLSAATVSSCSTLRRASSSSTRRLCSPVSRSSTKSASSSHASTGVRRCGSSRRRAGGTGWRALTSSIRLSCRSRRPRAAAYSSLSRSTSRRNSSGLPVPSGSASTSTRASVTRTPGAPRTRARSEPGSSERGSPVTRTRPSGDTLPRARRRQTAPCAYTTTESRVDPHLCADSACVDSAVMCSAPRRVHAERSLRPGDLRVRVESGGWRPGPHALLAEQPFHGLLAGGEWHALQRCGRLRLPAHKRAAAANAQRSF